MAQFIGLVTLLVRNTDEAIAFYVDRLGFHLVEDRAMGDGKRWVVVRPACSAQTGLLLAEATGERQQAAVGNQGGGRVMLFLHTEDFWRDYRAFRQRGVSFLEEPRDEPYGWVAVFEDLFGNRWDLIEPRESAGRP